MNTRALQLAVLQILDAAIGHLDHDLPLYGDWSVQGFGVLRLYIRRIGRLHIWDGRLRYPDVSLIHTHSWDLRSTVVVGRLVNTRYRESEIPGYGHPYKRHRLLTGYQARPVSEAADVRLLPEPREVYGPGDVYAQAAHEIHRSEPEDGTITLMERREDVDGQADVYWPASCTWGTATPRPATGEEVRRTVTLALAGLEEALR